MRDLQHINHSENVLTPKKNSYNPNSQPAMQAKMAVEEARKRGLSERELSKLYEKTYGFHHQRMAARKRGVKIRPPTSPVGVAIREAIEKLKREGLTDSAEIIRVRRRMWAHVQRRKKGQKERQRITPESIAAKAELARLRSLGVTDKKLLDKAYRGAYHRALTPESKARRRKTYAANIEMHKATARIRHQKNPHYWGIYARNKRLTNPQFVIISRLRTQVGRLFRGDSKPHTIDLIGCEPAFFARWICSQFKAGMGVHNSKLWHIDHIFPIGACCSIDDIRKSFFYKNLRPEWDVENVKKGITIIPDGLVSAFLCGISSILITRERQISESLEQQARGAGFTIIKPPMPYAS